METENANVFSTYPPRIDSRKKYAIETKSGHIDL